jgi:ubiquinone/menaquinone biosynthesis C-methylase UbiE
MPSYADVIRWVKPGVEFHQHRYARGLAEAVPLDCRWLDVGAGTKIHDGWLPPSAGDLAARARVLIGCDVVTDHLARNRLLTAAVSADAGSLPFASSSFDIVTANMVLEHLEDPRSVFAEIARVLARGGRFVFVTPNLSNPAIWIASVVLSRGVRRAMARVFESRAAEHVFVTHYRANSVAAITTNIAGLPLRIRRLEHFSGEPFVRRPWIGTLAEALWIKTIGHGSLGTLRTNLFGEIEKTAD